MHKRRQREFGSLFVAIGQTACHNLSKEYREECTGGLYDELWNAQAQYDTKEPA